MALKRGHGNDDTESSISKYGSAGGFLGMGLAISGSYVYTYNSIGVIKTEHKELEEKVLKLIEEGGQRKILIDKITRMGENTQQVEKTLAELKISIDAQNSRLDAVEAVLKRLGFDMNPINYSGQAGGYRDPPPAYPERPQNPIPYQGQSHYSTADSPSTAHMRDFQPSQQRMSQGAGTRVSSPGVSDLLHGL